MVWRLQRRYFTGYSAGFLILFSTVNNDLGCTDLVMHEIHTGNAKPVRQPPRKLPLAKKEEAEKM